MRNISARCGALPNRQSLIKSPRAMIFTSCTLQINATLLFVVGRFPNLKVNKKKWPNLTSICEGAMEIGARGKKVSWKSLSFLGKMPRTYLVICSPRYQDILQGDFFEDYFLLAYKSLTWMLWSKTKCGKVNKYIWPNFLLSQVPWIVKTDDDMINNIWKLGALVEALKFQRWHKSSGLRCSFDDVTKASQEHNHLLDQDGTSDQD